MTPHRAASPGRPGRRPWAAVCLVATLLVAAATGRSGAQGPPTGRDTVARVLRSATVVDADRPGRDVTLPDQAELSPAEQGPVRRHYRWRVDWPVAPTGQALYFPRLSAHARIAVNGQPIRDTLALAAQSLPRSGDRIVLLPVPDRLWRPGANEIALEAAGPQGFHVSTLEVGPLGVLTAHYRTRLFGVVVGPAFVAASVGTLGICVLLLWSRTRESLYGYFGAGAFFWALHSLWGVLPWPLLPGQHFAVWWTSLYTFFVGMLVIFCLRFAEWRLPKVERTIWQAALAGPAVLYGAWAAGWLDPAEELWRLGLVGLVAVGVAAVWRAALRKGDADSWMIAGASAVSLALALHDWWLAHTRADNPVFLVPYAGLLFVALVVRMLISRLVRSTQQIESMNAELEQRVETRSAELRAAVEQMRLARNEAESASLAKTAFLAAASHDLRQPAHALGLYMTALGLGRLDAEQADLVRRMSASLTALDTQFNALLDVSRLDADGITPQLRAFAIGPMLRGLADEFASQADAKGLRLALRLPAREGLAHSDEQLVERVLRNLLANALKYTQRGGVLLACRQRELAVIGAAGGRPHWRVEIWDTGIGIAAQDCERVFDEFVQLNNPGRDRSRGLGLGLAIVRRIVKRLDLRLELRSRPGRGSRFALSIPLSEPGRADAEDDASEADPAEVTDLGGLTVAVIEDDVEVRDAMRVLLERWGCRVVDGADADEIVRRMPAGRPADAIVADHRLADGRTGPREAQALARAWGVAVPAIVVTGDATPDLLHRLQGDGHACLAKPVVSGRLREWLEQASRQR